MMTSSPILPVRFSENLGISLSKLWAGLILKIKEEILSSINSKKLSMTISGKSTPFLLSASKGKSFYEASCKYCSIKHEQKGLTFLNGQTLN